MTGWWLMIDAFELWCWRKLLRVPSTATRSNQSILREISPEYSLEGLMLKLKLQYFGHLMQRTDSLEKTLMLRKIEGGRRRDNRGWAGWMASPTQWTWVWASSSSWWWTGKSGVLQSMGSQRVRHAWVTELTWLNGYRNCDLENRGSHKPWVHDPPYRGTHYAFSQGNSTPPAQNGYLGLYKTGWRQAWDP